MENVKKYQVKCLGLNKDFTGIVEVNHKKYSVFGLLPKEEAVISINEGSFQKTKLIKVLKPSSNRELVKCPIYDRCGGCQLLHIKYKQQLELKKEYVANCFKENNIPFKLDKIYPAKNLQNYRNKMQVAFRLISGKVEYGFYEEGTHKIIPLDNCLVQTPKQIQIVKTIKQLLTKMRIAPYDEDRRTGYFRYCLIREGFKTNEVLVTLVIASEVFPGRNDFLKKLREQCPFITTIIQNINPRKTSIILGEQEKVLFGPGYINDQILGINFRISSKSFFQINPEQTIELYRLVKEVSEFDASDTIIDAYCGVGTIGMVVSSSVKQVIGVENNKQAVFNAKSNARENNIKNITFINADATEFIADYSKQGANIDGLIMDPPRSGSTEKFLNTVLQLNPKKIVYVSCEASTLARDLKILTKKYKIKSINLVDLFIGTSHIETVCALSRIEK